MKKNSLQTVPGVTLFQQAPAFSQLDIASVVMVGGVDNSYFHGDLKWIPVIEPRYWQIIMDQ